MATNGNGVHPDNIALMKQVISEYTIYAKYARYLHDEKRRESFDEMVDRVEGMHIRRFPHLAEQIRWAHQAVREKRILPSMRVMQFGGAAAERENERVYNCSFSPVDRPRFFQEALYLLLCGTGVGYSVQFEHVLKLPPIKMIDENDVRVFVIQDDIEGWADALGELLYSYFYGGYVLEFDYGLIRTEGTPLKTSGGKAPGPEPLRLALEEIRKIMHAAQGRQILPLECHDIICLSADAVLSGGIRRSAMIALFSPEDEEMRDCKTGLWYETTPWRANSNNSAAFVRGREDLKPLFLANFEKGKEWGDPGSYFLVQPHYGGNPCVEIGLNSLLAIDKDVLGILSARRLRGKQDGIRLAKATTLHSFAVPAQEYYNLLKNPTSFHRLTHWQEELQHRKAEWEQGLQPIELREGQTYIGWQMCNLAEINASIIRTREEFLDSVERATAIGTLQATYTDFDYLGPVSEIICEREALLGVSMTGIMNNPTIALNPEILRAGAELAIRTNQFWSKLLGIREASRVTTVKPAGTTSLALGGVSSGIHADHWSKYIRRIVANPNETVFQYFRQFNPHMCVEKPDGDWVVEFPMATPPDGITKADLTALEFLEKVRIVLENWVLPGTAHPERSPGLTHNVSNTVLVRAHEWDGVAEDIWSYRHLYTGVSMLAETGDKDHHFAPFEAVTTPEDEEKWQNLFAKLQPVDYALLLEEQDGTMLQAEVACQGPVCEFVPISNGSPVKDSRIERHKEPVVAS